MDAHAEVSPLSRVVLNWEPGVWIGSLRRAFGPVAEVVQTPRGEVVENHPPHLLVALWKPQRLDRPFLRRWPNMVWLSERDSEHATLDLLREIPAENRLWLTQEGVDWALLAEIVMLTEEHLQPFHHRELQRLIVAERQAATAMIKRAYNKERQGLRGFSHTLPIGNV